MGFFKESRDTSPRNIARLQALIWILIYAGLLTLVLGLSVQRSGAPGLGWGMVLGGALVAAIGVVLIYVRSRLH